MNYSAGLLGVVSAEELKSKMPKLPIMAERLQATRPSLGPHVCPDPTGRRQAGFVFPLT